MKLQTLADELHGSNCNDGDQDGTSNNKTIGFHVTDSSGHLGRHGSKCSASGCSQSGRNCNETQSNRFFHLKAFEK